MARSKWPFGGQNGAAPPPQQDAAKAASSLVITTADGKKFGFENYCNNCYVNSVVQALYFCAPFRDLMLQAQDPSALQSVPTNLQPAEITTPPTAPATPSTAPIRRKPERKVSTHPTGEAPATSNGPTVSTTASALIPPSPPSLFSALRSLFYHISTHPNERGTVAPKAFVDKLKEINQVFNNTSHQDAHEFLNYLLNRIVEEVEEERKNEANNQTGTPPPGAEDLSNSLTTLTSNSGRSPEDATIVHKLFEGVLTSETRCLTCENVSSRDESFLDLSIDIEQNSSVTACLRSFSASEMLCNKNKFFCDSCCDLQEAEKRMKIKRLPNILALHLKRFKYQEERYIKLSYRVAFPFELRLFNTVDDVEEGDRDRLYQLFGIVVHIGNGPNHGHYVSIIKTMGTWLLFDDESVTPISESDIPLYFGDSNKGSAYMLYYQAVDIDRGKLGLRKEMEVESVLLTDREKEKRRVGELQIGNGSKFPPPGLDAPEHATLATNGSAVHDGSPSNASVTPTLPPHPLPPVPTTPSQHGRQSTDTDWTRISSPSIASEQPTVPPTPKNKNKLGTELMKSLRKAPSVSVRTGIGNFIGSTPAAIASSPNVSVPPAPAMAAAVSEPPSVLSAAMSPLEAVQSDPLPQPQGKTIFEAPKPAVNTQTEPPSTLRLVPRPHPLPAIPVPALEESLPSPPPDFSRSLSQHKAGAYLSPARPPYSPDIVGQRPSTSPRPLPTAPFTATRSPPIPARPVTSEGLNAESSGNHRRSLNAAVQPQDIKKEKKEKGWLRRSFRLGDKSKNAGSTQRVAEAGIVLPSHSPARNGLTVPGVLNIAREDNFLIPSPTSSTSSASPLRSTLAQQQKVSSPETPEVLNGHHRTPSADRPPSAFSHSALGNGTSFEYDFVVPPSPASSSFDSSAYTHESTPKMPAHNAHPRSRLPQPPNSHPPQSDQTSRTSPPVIASGVHRSRSIPAPLPPVPGSASTVYPTTLPPTPGSPEFSTPSIPFSIRTPTRKASLAAASNHGRGSVSGTPERKKSLPNFAGNRHKDKVYSVPPGVSLAGQNGSPSDDRHPEQTSARPSEDRPMPVLTPQHATFPKQPNGVPTVVVGGATHALNGQYVYSHPTQFPSQEQPLHASHHHHQQSTQSYVLETRDQIPTTLDPRRRAVVSTTPAEVPPLTSTNSHIGSPSVSSASSNFKRATRKLSLTVGFGRKDKDKEKEKDKKVSASSLAPSAFTFTA